MLTIKLLDKNVIGKRKIASLNARMQTISVKTKKISFVDLNSKKLKARASACSLVRSL